MGVCAFLKAAKKYSIRGMSTMPSNNTIKMCAAGSGKTWGICNDALSVVGEAQGKRALITTYTNKGVETVNNEIAKQNLGVPSSRIVIKSWFQFLMSELIRPFQSYITSINTLKSFDFSDRYGKINFAPKGTPRRYISGRYYVMKDFASELAVCLNELSRGAVISRLEKVYSHIFIDEFQDMAGYDFKYLLHYCLRRTLRSSALATISRQPIQHITQERIRLNQGLTYGIFALIQKNVGWRRLRKALLVADSIVTFAHLLIPYFERQQYFNMHV
jgi:hypothetical protein